MKMLKKDFILKLQARVLIAFFVLILICCLSLIYVYSPKKIEMVVYDMIHHNGNVTSFEAYKKILASYPSVGYDDLPANVQRQMQSPKGITRPEIRNLRFSVIPIGDAYRKMMLDKRIFQFTSMDLRPARTWWTGKKVFYLCADPWLMDMTFQLFGELNARGYNPAAIAIQSSYRTTSHNDKVGGALNSMHLFGKAFDLNIGDVNRDGIRNQQDKQIVYTMLDSKLIGNQGGLGFYPNTMIIHMDVRGKRSRWNHYNRKR
jgi:hypothetical protein